MIRFGRLFDLATEAEERRLAEVQQLFRRVFPREQEYAEELDRLLRDRAARDFEVALLTAEDGRGEMLGFAFVFFFPAIRYGFLDYIGSDPERSKRGIGRALYEGVREYLVAKNARGIFLEVPPDTADDPPSCQRMKFYERFGAYPIVGTRWEDPPERLDYVPPLLVYDGLGRNTPLRRDHARRAAREILRSRYRRDPDDPNVKAVIKSFQDDPVRLRPPRYRKQESAAAPMHGLIRPIKLLVSEHHEIHHVRERGYVERPARVRAILKALRALPTETRRVPRVGEGPIRAVHDPDFVSYLNDATIRLGPEETLYPQVFPIRRPERKPREMAIRAGYYCSDTFTPLSRAAYRAARAAVNCAMAGAELLRGGEHLVYAICRPPGHHAERRIYGGFCYFNNAAVAAHALSAAGRVALLDIDYHHGNGQQDIFYRRADVMTISLHGHPRDHYPYFAGYADERGEEAGEGYNRNYPVKDLIGDDGYLRALETALDDIRAYRPMWLVLALGFDTMRGDPTGNFNLSANGLRKVGEAIGRLELPTLVVQEGGYSLRNLGIGALGFFSGLVKAWYA